ncbi:MAG: LOG family protein [Akkermansiaceae bacterium]|nr:LOG family protein [Akkermansiaceae bacterium]MCP5543498.1 LOG family protein [Akkermansiaceae bacterium]MCP5546836.1 LOG family protein [Akkermansiaceae bacterium]
MPTVRLSGTILGAEDPSRATRARILYLLFSAGWDIYNSNGDQRITLSNIEKKIIESDAFVFTPGPSIEDMFKAVSIFVGYQTLDPHLAGKPTVLLNTDFSWDPFFSVLNHLNRMGTIKQDFREFLLNTQSPEGVLECLEAARSSGVPDAGRHKMEDNDTPIPKDVPPPDTNIGNVCVFCSASLEDPHYLEEGEALGRMLALNNLGCVSGAGKSGIMGAVVRGSAEAGGWAAGSNVPHIIELEGLPEGLSQFWMRPDIYTRMEVMIENSDAFVIFPGGAGTFQELLALMIFRHQGNPLMKNKPVVIYNRKNAAGIGFWDPLIDLLDGICVPGEFVVANTLKDIIPQVTKALV